MFFEIIPAVQAGPFEGDVIPEPVVKRRWVYRRGTAKNPGDSVCQSTTIFSDEAAARASIAEARKAFAGSRFAKVEVE